MTPRPRQRWQRILELGFLLAGLAMFVLVLTRRPLADIYAAFASMGPIAVLAPIVIAACFAMRASALWLLVGPELPWAAALFTRLVGDGYNGLLPMAGLGGEPLKLGHLTGYVEVDVAVAALVRDRVIDNAFGFIVAAAAIAIALPQIAAPTPMRDALWLFAALGGAIGLASLWLVFTRLPGRAGKLIGAWLRGGKLEPPRLAWPVALRAGAWLLGCRLANFAETAILLAAVGVPVELTTVLIVDGALNAAGFVGFVFPQGVGVVEGTAVYVLEALGVPPAAALAFALARRGRMLAFNLLGIGVHIASRSITTARRAR